MKNVLSLKFLLTLSISYAQLNEKKLLEKSAKAAEKVLDTNNLD